MPRPGRRLPRRVEGEHLVHPPGTGQAFGLLGNEHGACGDDEHVVAEDRSVRESDLVGPEIDVVDRARHRRSRGGAGDPSAARCRLRGEPERHEEQARLVYVTVVLVDDGDLCLGVGVRAAAGWRSTFRPFRRPGSPRDAPLVLVNIPQGSAGSGAKGPSASDHRPNSGSHSETALTESFDLPPIPRHRHTPAAMTPNHLWSIAGYPARQGCRPAELWRGLASKAVRLQELSLFIVHLVGYLPKPVEATRHGCQRLAWR